MSSVSNVSIKALHLSDEVSFNCADLTINQTFSPTWSAEQAYGKMDPISTFSHVGRTAQIQMVLLSTTAAKARALQDKVDRFVKFQYPQYKQHAGAAVLSSPPFFEVTTLHEKLYSVLKGYVTALSVTPGSGEDLVPLVSHDGMLFERKYTIDFTMTVMHSYLPGWLSEIAPGQDKGGHIFRNSELVAAAGHQIDSSAKAQADAALNLEAEGIIAAASIFGGEGPPPISEHDRNMAESIAQFAPGSNGRPVITKEAVQAMSLDPDTPVSEFVNNQGGNQAVSADTANESGPTSETQQAKANANAAPDSGWYNASGFMNTTPRSVPKK